MWCSFFLNVAGSIASLVLLYGLYIWCSFKFSSNKASAEVWWLPAWNCFRFVIRNIPYGYEVTDIRSTAWLRDLIPSRDGSSVNSFKDTELTHDGRLMLATNQDYPLLCFRLRRVNDSYHFVLTDKFGTEIKSCELSEEFKQLVVQYSAKLQTWKLFKYECSRTYVIPYRDPARGEIFSKLFAMQQGPEARVPVMFLSTEVIRVSI
jgi:hypothetical protein